MFEVTVVNRAAFGAAGMKVRTNMEKAMQDCSSLWHDVFGPRMGEMLCEPSESYGVSYLVDPGQGVFDYFAVLPYPEARDTPQGMERIQVPAGLYAQCPITSLEQISSAYAFIFTQWLPAHPEYAVNMSAPSYELYPADFMQNGQLTICFPLQKA